MGAAAGHAAAPCGCIAAESLRRNGELYITQSERHARGSILLCCYADCAVPDVPEQ